MEQHDLIYVPGHTGMVGSAIVRELEKQGYDSILLASKSELDLTQQEAVRDWFEKHKPQYVFLCAAKVGGIAANMAEPASFLYSNLMITTNIIHSAYKNGVRKLLNFGSSCVYPRLSPQPMREEYILSGPLEPTNEGYAIAKIAGLRMCEYYQDQYGFNTLSIIPPNLYGPEDNFDPARSHVIAALIQKFHNAKKNNEESVTLWGTGKARREFMYVEDLAEAAIYLMNHYDSKRFINVGTGVDITIHDLAKKIANIVGFDGKIQFDTTMPDGMPQKLMDISE
ncbi:MAG: GDP-L-fucose synthase family protein, partial [Promethearchaeota archaeon]